MGAQSQKGIDALVAAGVDVGNAEDVGRSVACQGVAEEDWSSRDG